MKVGVLSSGELGFSILKKIIKTYTVKFVLTDSNSENIIKYSKSKKINLYKGKPLNQACYSFLKQNPVDVIISVNYLFLINDKIINHSKIITFNIHGSLLPKYRGRTPHVWAIINNEKTHGVTAHIIDQGCDTGPILFQEKIKINKRDTGFSLLKKMEKKYFPLIQKVLKNINNKNKELILQDNSKATYFGKRTPSDGLINWDWKSIKIYNWIRAQSYPYPGAYFYINNEKTIIDESKFVIDKTLNHIENGKIISLDPLKIKSLDGYLIIEKTRFNYKFILNTKLS